MAGSAVLAMLPLLAAAGIEPRAAEPDTRVDRAHVLIVNSAEVPLRCILRVPGGEWSEVFTLEPAYQVVPEAGRKEGGMAELLCEAPVRRVRYNLRPGGRYALLRDPGEDGEVRLYSVPDERD